jgi:hypothetical protein
MSTYTVNLKAEKNITKNDIIIMSYLLNTNNDFKQKWYKSVRLCYKGLRGKLYFVDEKVICERYDNDDVIYHKNTKFIIFLKSFTLDELKIGEKCFNQIGIVKV